MNMKTATVCILSFLVVQIGGHSGPVLANVKPEQTKPRARTLFTLTIPLPEVPETMTVYASVEPKHSKADVEALMKAFNMDGPINDLRRQFVVKDGEKVLTVYKEPGTGYVRFSNNAKLGGEEKAERLPSKHEAEKVSREFLKTNRLLPDNTFCIGVKYSEYLKYDAKCVVMEKGRTAVSVRYLFTLGQRRVVGPGAKVGLTFGENGQIIGASKIWREIEPAKEMSIRTAEEAFEEFKKRWPEESGKSEEEQADITTEVHVREFYLAYYAEPGNIPQEFIEPVYVFKGDYLIHSRRKGGEIRERDVFEIMIPAIPD